MNRRLWMSSLLSGMLLLSAESARGQEPPPPPFGGPMELLGFEGGHGGHVIKGAPYSATAVSETTQKLADGTTIYRTTQSGLFRDSQGRSRRELTPSGIAPLGASGKTHTLVTISDPVAGAHYLLDAEQKVARKMTLRPHGRKNGTPEAAQMFQEKMNARMQKEEASGAIKKESLGTQTINGVSAEGTRITRTIPTGEIGNDKAIQVVSERWYSLELQIVVKSVRSDPRFGTTTYTVTNIQRSEPEAALFAIPADYAVKQGGRDVMYGHGFEKAPPPPND